MIIVRFSSGLGNQMFQYNFYRYLTEKYPNTEVKADLTWFYANDDHHGYELERVFGGAKAKSGSKSNGGLLIKEATKKEIFRVTGQIPPMIKGPLAGKFVYLMGPVNRIMRERAKTDKSVNHIDQLGGSISNYYETNEKGEKYNPLFDFVNNLDVTRDWYFTGFWIEERYYGERIDRVRQELVFAEAEDEANLDMLSKIENGNSVSIHVRRGDYLNATYSSMFKSLGREYYEEAVRILREKVDNPHFYLFSDDPEYMNEAFEWLPERTIVNINSGDASYRDMYLMSHCKHNIVANSTFSQWGALLNVNEGHMTIYPSAYLADEDTEVKTLPGWIRV